MDWNHIDKVGFPPEKETVWAMNINTNFVALACRVYVDEGWFWAVSNGTMCIEAGKIVSECELDDDYDFTHWIALPLPANNKKRVVIIGAPSHAELAMTAALAHRNVDVFYVRPGEGPARRQETPHNLGCLPILPTTLTVNPIKDPQPPIELEAGDRYYRGRNIPASSKYIPDKRKKG